MLRHEVVASSHLYLLTHMGSANSTLFSKEIKGFSSLKEECYKYQTNG